MQIKNLKKYGPRVKKGNSTDIWQTAGDGDLPAVRFYYKQDATLISNQNENDKYKNTPLIKASWNGHLNIVKFLVKKGGGF